MAYLLECSEETAQICRLICLPYLLECSESAQMCRLIYLPYNGVFVRMLGGDSANMQADLLTVFVRMLGVSANVQADLPTV